MSDLTEILKTATPEQIQKAGVCKTTDELLAFAKAEKIDITTEQAEEIVKMLNPPHGELSDQELDNIAGGEDKTPDYSLRENICRNCGYHYYTSEPIGTKVNCIACNVLFEIYK